MKKSLLILTACSCICIAQETVVKSSAPFAFPLDAGVMSGLLKNAPDFFRASITHTGSPTILFNWSLPIARGNGTIEVYDMAGSLLQRLPVAKPSGTVIWTGRRNNLPAGIYLVSLSCGPLNRNLKFFFVK